MNKVSDIQIELEFRNVWFLRRGENWSTRRKTSWSRVENQQQTQPTYDGGSGNRTRDTLVGGERSHHCANLSYKGVGGGGGGSFRGLGVETGSGGGGLNIKYFLLPPFFITKKTI